MSFTCWCLCYLLEDEVTAETSKDLSEPRAWLRAVVLGPGQFWLALRGELISIKLSFSILRFV